MKFIIIVNEIRIYAGEFISFFSAMAIKHPVIIYNISELDGMDDNCIQIKPTIFDRNGDITEYFIEIIENKSITRIKDYFESINKLK
jgi:hypothetical protein